MGKGHPGSRHQGTVTHGGGSAVATVRTILRRRELLTLALTTVASAVMPRAGMGQGRYPERPIKLMVAFSAGGVNDVVGRQWAERIKSLLGTVYVENQGGGTGTIASGEVARAPADGYTLLL